MSDKKETKLQLDAQGNPVLYLAMYARATKTGNVRYLGIGKFYDEANDKYVTAPLVDETFNTTIALVLGNVARDTIMENCEEKVIPETGETIYIYPDSYVKPKEFSMRVDLDSDGNSRVDKKGKKSYVMFLQDFEYIKKIPVVKVNPNQVFKQ